VGWGIHPPIPPIPEAIPISISKEGLDIIYIPLWNGGGKGEPLGSPNGGG